MTNENIQDLSVSRFRTYQAIFSTPCFLASAPWHITWNKVIYILRNYRITIQSQVSSVLCLQVAGMTWKSTESCLETLGPMGTP